MKPDASAVPVLSSEDQTTNSLVRERTRTFRNGLFCTLIFATCFWISWPIAQMGFVDDWSYIKTAQVFAQTGHFVYNGWATAMLGWQILWGALFIHLFGFSFMTVKLSTFPLACASVSLFYVIQIRFGIRPRNAILGTLTLGLSPLFLPLAASFMTDIPGLFVILLCLYCCQRAIAAQTGASTIAWLSLAAASNVAGGTARQIAWLGAFVMVPSTAWFLRKRRGILTAAVLLWAGSLASVLYSMHWFAKQPYSLSMSLFAAPANPFGNPFLVAILYVSGEFFCMLLVLFPVTVAWLPRFRTARRSSLMAAASILLLWVFLQIVGNWRLPWVPHVIQTEFSGSASSQTAAVQGPLDFPASACLLFSLIIVAAALSVAAAIRDQLRAGRGFLRSAFQSSVLWLLAPFSFCYCALLFVQALQGGVGFDRYLLGLMPIAIVLLCQLYELSTGPRLPAIAVITLAIYAVLAIAGTHDWFAWHRARLAAIAELRAAAIPRTAIEGGFEYDGWTEVETTGYLNDGRIKIPPGAFQPHPSFPKIAALCKDDFPLVFPAIHPQYTIAYGPAPCRAPTNFPPVHYVAWLPPFRRTIYVRKIPQIIGTAAQPFPDRSRPG